MSESSERAAHGVAAGAGAALAGALLLGALQGAAGPRGPELGYWALGIGLLVGAVLGKVGGPGRSVALWGIPLALAGVALAQVLAAGMQVEPGGMPAWHLGPAIDHWFGEILGENDVIFYTVAALEGYLVAQRVAE
ncbi:hypothetical protein [Streptomyces sp. NPDC048639]|uniref:hypothetical protein n=1 Tax=Streptomyces sp. NPDC048639 TaxID=3365581 RepID=UPI0037180198